MRRHARDSAEVAARWKVLHTVPQFYLRNFADESGQLVLAERPALTHNDLENVRSAIRAWIARDRPGPKSSDDMVDIIDLMLASGARIGEVSYC